MSDDVAERTRVFSAQHSGAGPGALSRQVMASWRRSEDYGISLDRVEPVFTGTDDVDCLFHHCGTEVLADLFRSLSTEPISLMLTDPDGVVLNRLSGDRSLLASLDQVHLAPGFAYAERDVGTNGVGLALADQVPTLVRADQHYSLSLRGFTCAAVPVLDPATGRLQGSVNLTTWSDSSHALLLTLARSAASNTSALMLARSSGRRARPTPRGQVFRVEVPRIAQGDRAVASLPGPWQTAVERLADGVTARGTVTAVGEPGSGRATALAQAVRLVLPRARVLSAATPAPADVGTWLDLWAPELAKPDTAIVVCDVDVLPTWGIERIAEIANARHEGLLALTAERLDDMPPALLRAIDAIVSVPPLRDRPQDIPLLADYLAHRTRGRDLHFTAAATRALTRHDWPGNIDELAQVVADLTHRGDTVDAADLPPAVLAGTTRNLSRIEAFERGEIIRVFESHKGTMSAAAAELGMSRATLYRKLAQYGIRNT